MAKILIVFFSNVTWTKEKYKDSYIEEFTNVLVRHGNNCLSLMINDFLEPTGKKICKINTKKLQNDISLFNPDLIISFNNVLPDRNIFNYTNCPIACFSADSPIWWANKDLIKSHLKRYLFFHFSPDMIANTKEVFPFISEDQNHLFGIATDFKRKDLSKTINISFVGSFNIWNKLLVDKFRKMDSKKNLFDFKTKFIENINTFSNNPLKTIQWGFDHSDDEEITRAVQLMLTAKIRLTIAEQLSDFGLTIFTAPQNIHDMMLYHLDIWKCINHRTVCTLDDIEDVYNRSRICLNMPHIQAVNGFSWRVAEILASSSCLVSNFKPYLHDLMKPYIDLPMYESAAEAREICQKLLKDESLRNDIVLASNTAVEEKFRFEDKFQKMEKILNIKLFEKNIEGHIYDLDPTSYIIEKTDTIRNVKYRFYYKVWEVLNRKLKKKGIIK